MRMARPLRGRRRLKRPHRERLTDGIERDKKESLDLTQHSPGMSPVTQCSEDNKFWYLSISVSRQTHPYIGSNFRLGLVAPWDIGKTLYHSSEILVLHVGCV